MKKMFSRWLSLVISIAVAVTMVVIFAIQTLRSQSEYLVTEEAQLAQISRKIDENTEAIQSLKESLNIDSLAKANAFAYMVAQKPDILEDGAALSEIKTLLNVDELHVTDEKGVLTWGTEPGMFGFDFSTNEQTKPFLAGLTDKSFALAQDPQPNATFGVLFQYVGVSRKDKAGVVQIGLRPERLEQAMENNKIENLLANLTVGANGYIFALNQSDMTVAAHPDREWIGKSYSELGLPEQVSTNKKYHGFAKVDGVSSFITVQPYSGYIIGAAVPRVEVYSGRNLFCLLVLAMMAVIFGVLIAIIRLMLDRQIISGIRELSGALSRITGGDLDTIVNVRTNQEFVDLSSGINEMVDSMRAQISESQRFLENERGILQRITAVSDKIDRFSGEMREVSQILTAGATEQEAAVRSLSAAFEDVSGGITETADKAQEARRSFTAIEDKLTVGNREMGEMLASMERISTQSKQIGAIIKAIDEIASQTNILALNAAVEAARAGEAGKGFAVVADEVRNLASKSAKSAKDTGNLVEQTLHIVEEGALNASRTAATLDEIVTDSKTAVDLIDSISGATKEQTNQIANVLGEVSHISQVVSSNSDSAARSAAASDQLSAQAKELTELTAGKDKTETVC